VIPWRPELGWTDAPIDLGAVRLDGTTCAPVPIHDAYESHSPHVMIVDERRQRSAGRDWLPGRWDLVRAIFDPSVLTYAPHSPESVVQQSTAFIRQRVGSPSEAMLGIIRHP
jgi:hypothetical protein